MQKTTDDDIQPEELATDALMTKEQYFKTAKHWRKRLQAKGDEQSRFTAAGKGAAFNVCYNVRDALRDNPNARPVRGYKLRCMQLNSGETVIRAVFHMLIAHPASAENATERFECVTAHLPQDVESEERKSRKIGFVFVPSRRAHAELTDADLKGRPLCGNQSFEAAPFRGELMLFRRHFLDARRGGAERIRLVQAGAESVTTRPT